MRRLLPVGECNFDREGVGGVANSKPLIRFGNAHAARLSNNFDILSNLSRFLLVVTRDIVTLESDIDGFLAIGATRLPLLPSTLLVRRLLLHLPLIAKR